MDKITQTTQPLYVPHILDAIMRLNTQFAAEMSQQYSETSYEAYFEERAALFAQLQQALQARGSSEQSGPDANLAGEAKSYAANLQTDATEEQAMVKHILTLDAHITSELERWRAEASAKLGQLQQSKKQRQLYGNHTYQQANSYFFDRRN